MQGGARCCGSRPIPTHNTWTLSAGRGKAHEPRGFVPVGPQVPTRARRARCDSRHVTPSNLLLPRQRRSRRACRAACTREFVRAELPVRHRLGAETWVIRQAEGIPSIDCAFRDVSPDPTGVLKPAPKTE